MSPWWGVLAGAVLSTCALLLAWHDYFGPDDHE